MLFSSGIDSRPPSLPRTCPRFIRGKPERGVRGAKNGISASKNGRKVLENGKICPKIGKNRSKLPEICKISTEFREKQPRKPKTAKKRHPKCAESQKTCPNAGMAFPDATPD
jgi:hypothetical protein